MGWRWNEEQQQAFNTIIKHLCSAPILAFVDYELPFMLHTDASNGGLGAVLYQQQQGHKRVIAYASRGLRPSEKLPSTQAEIFGIEVGRHRKVS